MGTTYGCPETSTLEPASSTTTARGIRNVSAGLTFDAMAVSKRLDMGSGISRVTGASASSRIRRANASDLAWSSVSTASGPSVLPPTFTALVSSDSWNTTYTTSTTATMPMAMNSAYCSQMVIPLTFMRPSSPSHRHECFGQSWSPPAGATGPSGPLRRTVSGRSPPRRSGWRIKRHAEHGPDFIGHVLTGP